MPRKKAPVSKQPSVRQVKRAAGIEVEKNAIVLLKADHREAEQLFKKFKLSKSATEQQAIARRVCAALKLHMRLEEEIFYPAFIEATGNKEIHGEALVEHDAAKKLIQEIERSVAGDPLFEAKVKVLSEMIKHHVKEEERFTGMFARARIARMDLRALGILLEARKQELSRKPATRQEKTPRGARAGFMGAAAVARSRAAKSEPRRAS